MAASKRWGAGAKPSCSARAGVRADGLGFSQHLTIAFDLLRNDPAAACICSLNAAQCRSVDADSAGHFFLRDAQELDLDSDESATERGCWLVRTVPEKFHDAGHHFPLRIP